MTPEQIKNLILEKSKWDPERVQVESKPDHLGMVVTVDGLTEPEQRALQRVLHDVGQSAVVVRRDRPGKPPAYNLDQLNLIVRHLGTTSDRQLDPIFAKRCQDLPEGISLDEILKFIRNLRDECVFSAGASDFMMTLFNCLLEDYPEPEDVKKLRRAELEEHYGL